jgi:hypothetical protein
MADLSQFLNSGGKRSRIVSRTSTSVGSTPLTITPAADEYVVYSPTNYNLAELSTSRATLPSVGLAGSNAAEFICFGLGEAVTITSEGASVQATVSVYEEY